MIQTPSLAAYLLLLLITTALKTLWWVGVIAGGIVVSRRIGKGNS